MRKMIRNGKIVTPSGVIDGSIIVVANRISHIIEGDDLILVQTDHHGLEIIDADGCYVLPASLYPARAVGLADRIGSLEEGKDADLILVRHNQGELPIVERAMVAGKWTFSK